MPDVGYALVFRGEIVDGFDRFQVMRQFGESFGLPVEEVAKVFSRPRVVLKRGLSREAAGAMCNRLLGIGMAVSVDAPGAEAAAASPAAVASSGADAAALPIADAASPRALGAPPAAPPAPAASAQGDDELRVVPFRFSGEGFEFFRIWIVNVLLTIVTLGIYSAWAKVRTQRYFHGNTRLEGASFEYLARPLAILKGRMLAFGLLMAYLLAEQFLPLLGAFLSLAFAAVMPWAIMRGVAFRNHNSAWRGVRFGFDGGLGEAYRVFLLYPLLGVLTLGLLFPWAMRQQQAYLIGNSRYGTSRFEFEAQTRSFYRIFLVLLGVMVGGFAATMVVAMVVPLLGPLVSIATYLAAFALFNVMLANLKFNHTRLGMHAMEADYDVRSYAVLMLTNTLALLLTLGLFYPWAKVRNARYAAEHVRVLADGDLGEFAAAQREEVSAVGGEIGDVFDVEVAI